MNPLEQLELEQELKGRTKPVYKFRSQAELNKGWKDLTDPLLNILIALASAQSLEEVKTIQKAIADSGGELATITPQELFDFSRELVTLWESLSRNTDEESEDEKEKQKEKQRKILRKWFEHYPIDGRGPYWAVYFQSGMIFPTSNNYRAMIARICFDKRNFLGKCQNPNCGRYFVKPRKTSRFCMSEGCRKYDLTQRQDRHQDKKKSARESRKRKH